MNLHRVVLRALLVSGVFLCQIHFQTAVGQVRVVEAVDDARRITLSGNIHPLARAEFDRGAVAESQPMNRILLLLKRSDEQEAALEDMLAKQQDKSSPSFHAWLTPEQFGAQFGPADADIQAVTDWLTRQGFSIGKIYSGKTVIEFSGTAGQVQRAFGTFINNYQVNGKLYSANASDPQIPAALAPVVRGVVSLHNFPKTTHLRRVGVFRKGKPVGPVDPLYTSFGAGYLVAPADFAAIYNSAGLISAGNDGTGQDIAIVGETNFNLSDVQNFRQLFNLPANFTSANIIVNGEDPGITSTDEETEADLDVEWSGAVARGAQIKFVTSSSTASTAGIDLSALYIIEHNLAGVMSESYGACEQGLGSAGNAFYNSLWEQAAAQGITAILSAGDGGSAGCDDFNAQLPATHGLAVSGLASTPFNIAVGGTDFDQENKWQQFWSSTNDPVTSQSALGYIPETTWNDSCADTGLSGCATGGTPNIVAGSGGPSTIYAKPSWQIGTTGMPNDNKRDLPDISLFSGNGLTESAYIVCQADVTTPPESSCNLSILGFTYIGVGGTSAAAPAFAGIMALVNQKTASRQGNANQVLYQLVKQAGATCNSTLAPATGNSCSFYDITKGNNSVPCAGNTANCSSKVASGVGVLVGSNGQPAWPTTTGYDLATGLGTVNAANMVNNWSSVATVPTKTTLALNPTANIPHGASQNVGVTVNVSETSGTGVPGGDVSLIAQMPDGTTRGLDQFKLTSGAISGAKTDSLPGGTYSVYAHYAGDGTNAPSDSSAVSVTVNSEPSQTFVVVPLYDPTTGNLVNGNTSSVPYGSPYRIRIYVTNSSSTPNPSGPPNPTCDQVNMYTCPTGSLTLTANGQPVDRPNGIYQLNDIGYTRDINPTLTGGSYSLVAQYSGDSSYTGSTSATHTLTVTPAATRILPSNPPLPPQVSTPFGLAVTLTTDVFGVMPSCNFTFYDGTTALPGTVNCQWQANGPFLYTSLPISQASSGTHTYSVKFAGDQNYAPSASSPMTTRVFEGTTTTLTADSLTVQYGTNINLTAVVDSTVSQGPAISQTVNFLFENNPVTGTVTYSPFSDSSGNIALRAKITTQPQSSGFYSAIFPGDSTYGQSGALINVTVNIPDFSVAANLTSSSITAGNSGTGTVTVTPLSSSSSPVNLACPANGMPVGISCSFSPGTVNLSNSNPATSALTISTLAPSPSTSTSFVPLQPPLFYFSPRLFWPLFAASLFTLLFLYFLPVRIRRRRLALGTAIASAMALLLGFAGCGGGSSGAGGGGGPAPSSITLTTSSVKVPWNNISGGSVNLTANVTSSSTPGGTVTFFIDSSNGFSVSSPVAGGVAQLALTSLSVGVHTITAQYSGTANIASSQTKGSLNIAVTGPAGFSLQANTGGLFHTIGVNFTLQ